MSGYLIEPKQMNGLALAYMGDAVLEQYVRHRLLKGGNIRPNLLHKEATRYVSAKAQSKILFVLLNKFPLSEEEQGIIRRGRNAKSGTVPKNTDVVTYRNATGLEAIIGYLYMENQQERLTEVMNFIFENIDEEKGVR